MIEEQIIKLTRCILHYDRFFRYNDIVLSIEETEFKSPMSFTTYTRISIAPPIYMRHDLNNIYSVMYEKRGLEQYKESRINAAQKLAHEVVTKLLPKLDFKLKQEVYNYELEKALEVLD